MTLAVCPGSFDPITLGHVDVIRRASMMFDEIIVAIGANPGKNYLFSVIERADQVREAVKEIPGVRVGVIPGLVAEYCVTVGASAIVKGLRGAADYEGEQAMALMNRHLTGTETVFVMGDPNLGHIASSLVKDVANHGGDVTDLVPEHVAQALAARAAIKENR
ncbi:pantetheine-phosphate adenylyltransferase [Changpingibacter yushuensis]|uniref:pantetheine-phosphate adenylyltransferase n=1 Tax=Changpingibacter yushuensis TaxID=2758440 RepID=UPI0015F4D0D0|nr:pantetheine-phosphate adenylyltransferase [Changpingibacter yushuensis]